MCKLKSIGYKKMYLVCNHSGTNINLHPLALPLTDFKSHVLDILKQIQSMVSYLTLISILPIILKLLLINCIVYILFCILSPENCIVDIYTCIKIFKRRFDGRNELERPKKAIGHGEAVSLTPWPIPYRKR